GGGGGRRRGGGGGGGRGGTAGPAGLSEPATWASAAWMRATSKPARRMSLVPTMTLATSGRSSRARGSCTRSTSAARAPLAARLTRCPPDRPCARNAAQPRQPPPGAGSPTPSVIESPSAAKVVIVLPLPVLTGGRPPEPSNDSQVARRAAAGGRKAS